jgi:hypothetical protein
VPIESASLSRRDEAQQTGTPEKQALMLQPFAVEDTADATSPNLHPRQLQRAKADRTKDNGR